MSPLSVGPSQAAVAAPERIREGILRYNTNVLQRRFKYHETVAFSRIVADRMEVQESWQGFAARVGDILNLESLDDGTQNKEEQYECCRFSE